jgi:hypothetical protein
VEYIKDEADYLKRRPDSFSPLHLLQKLDDCVRLFIFCRIFEQGASIMTDVKRFCPLPEASVEVLSVRFLERGLDGS